ncbi:uncharacterized protein DUF3343 [Hydrogenoanaerobacterium saccharovorans]|uniref:Putative Se/S carrier protein-like domain-containing protein n=1 Tax=Hydrogenoanaerobacterium saccharovorans TaxID=474960 RepID=A0A1H8D5U5_9FIRM|nr:uncharacterized protein DUF3343 [Hydrogenoanaerobacterium saccharovorans]SEN01988.1 Protein of unknown function [Hydrogenoanaerobacterium saccharovorans]
MMYYLLSFSSTHDGIATKMHLRNKFDFTILPTPREIHASCGISIRIHGEDIDSIIALLASLKLNSDRVQIYRIITENEKNVYEPIQKAPT